MAISAKEIPASRTPGLPNRPTYPPVAEPNSGAALMNKPLKMLLADIPKRFVLLISKLLSFKTAVLGAFMYLYLRQSMDVWALVLIAGIAMFGREIFKYIKDIRG